MKEKLKDDKFAKDLLFKFISVLVIASAALLLLNVMTGDKDGRMQIIDENGGSEYQDEYGETMEEARLARILSDIKGVGRVDVMITYVVPEETGSVFTDSDQTLEKKVRGVIVTARGAESPVIARDIINAVSAVYDIPAKNVIVFEKNEEGNP